MTNSNFVQQFKKGSFEMVLLCLIAERETYGYEIIANLNKKGGSIFGYAKEGTVYPMLYRLQNAGLIQCRIAPSPANGGSRKFYSITEQGKEALRELILFWRGYQTCVDGFIEAVEGMEV